MANQYRVGSHATTVATGGWETVTTKARMNQASNQFGLGYRVVQKDFAWMVAYRDKVLPFVDGMVCLSR